MHVPDIVAEHSVPVVAFPLSSTIVYKVSPASAILISIPLQNYIYSTLQARILSIYCLDVIEFWYKPLSHTLVNDLEPSSVSGSAQRSLQPYRQTFTALIPPCSFLKSTHRLRLILLTDSFFKILVRGFRSIMRRNIKVAILSDD